MTKQAMQQAHKALNISKVFVASVAAQWQERFGVKEIHPEHQKVLDDMDIAISSLREAMEKEAERDAAIEALAELVAVIESPSCAA